MKGKVSTIFSVARRLLDEKGGEGARAEAQAWHDRFVANGNADEEERWRHVLLALDRLEALDEQSKK